MGEASLVDPRLCVVSSAPRFSASLPQKKMSTLRYFNGKLNIFEYILPNKTCQSYSWVTLSDMISCDTTRGVPISGDVYTFLSHNVNCKVTKVARGKLPASPEVETSLTFRLEGFAFGGGHDADVNCVFCQFAEESEQLWFALIFNDPSSVVALFWLPCCVQGAPGARQTGAVARALLTKVILMCTYYAPGSNTHIHLWCIVSSPSPFFWMFCGFCSLWQIEALLLKIWSMTVHLRSEHSGQRAPLRSHSGLYLFGVFFNCFEFKHTGCHISEAAEVWVKHLSLQMFKQKKKPNVLW